MAMMGWDTGIDPYQVMSYRDPVTRKTYNYIAGRESELQEMIDRDRRMIGYWGNATSNVEDRYITHRYFDYNSNMWRTIQVREGDILPPYVEENIRFGKELKASEEEKQKLKDLIAHYYNEGTVRS